MDFRCQLISAGGASRFTADAVLVLTLSDQPAAEPAFAAALADAVAEGDFELKPGKLAYLRRVEGVKAPRVALAHAGEGPVRGVRQAMSVALSQLKALGVRHLAVQLAAAEGAGGWSEAQAEAVVSAAADAGYVYRSTKPSAPSAPKLAKVTLLAGSRAALAAAERGIARGAAVAEGVLLARELANRPGNHCTPTMLANEARKMARAQGLKCEVLERKQIEAQVREVAFHDPLTHLPNRLLLNDRLSQAVAASARSGKASQPLVSPRGAWTRRRWRSVSRMPVGTPVSRSSRSSRGSSFSSVMPLRLRAVRTFDLPACWLTASVSLSNSLPA